MIDKRIKYIKCEFKLRFINQIEINPSNDTVNKIRHVIYLN